MKNLNYNTSENGLIRLKRAILKHTYSITLPTCLWKFSSSSITTTLKHFACVTFKSWSPTLIKNESSFTHLSYSTTAPVPTNMMSVLSAFINNLFLTTH